MTISKSATSSFSESFYHNIAIIKQYAVDSNSFHRKLYFSNVISLLEKYLSDLFLYEITTKESIFNRMTSAQKFQNQKYPVAEIFNGNVKEKVIKTGATTTNDMMLSLKNKQNLA